MKNKRVKGYWLKRKEKFQTGSDAKARAGYLRLNNHTAHVMMSKKEDQYQVNYSVAKWYWEELQQLKIEL